MKDIVANRSKDKRVEDKVFVAAKRAQESVAKYPRETINATLGVLMTDDGRLVTFDEVWKTYLNLDIEKDLASYSASFKGENDYIEAVKKWLFNDIDKKFHTDIVATTGGSGAVGLTFQNYLDPGEEVLLPCIGWQPYWIMATENRLKVREYELFSGKSFNLDSLKKESKSIMDNQGKVMLVLNDPCHNPTGYTMSYNEFKDMIDYLDELAKKGPVVILLDIAYMDFANNTLEARKKFELFNNRSENLLGILAFSLSKTLTAYGLRVGAQVAMSSSLEVIEDFVRVNEFTARSIWSNIPKGGMKLFEKLLSSEEKLKDISSERDEGIESLRKKSKIFIEEASECHLDIYPYRDGFFITIKIEDNTQLEEVYERLMDTKIFGIRVKRGIRIAICSLSIEKVRGLAKKIKEAF